MIKISLAREFIPAVKCSYLHERYGRFPVYQPPLRTLLGFQVNHLDTDFYDRFYRPEALTDLQRNHFQDWHDSD